MAITFVPELWGVPSSSYSRGPRPYTGGGVIKILALRIARDDEVPYMVACQNIIPVILKWHPYNLHNCVATTAVGYQKASILRATPLGCRGVALEINPNLTLGILVNHGVLGSNSETASKYNAFTCKELIQN